jgi:hypothetical protein
MKISSSDRLVFSIICTMHLLIKFILIVMHYFFAPIYFNCPRLSMAACKSVQEWLLPAKPLLIVRYLGTTPDSSSLAPLLTSICQQLSYTFMLPFEDIPDDLVPPFNLFCIILSSTKWFEAALKIC